jgi:DNA-binding response OmpR family regulator
LPRILIVDDDRTTVRLLQTLLEMDGFEVFTAARGQQALDMAHDVHPDVFLVDFHLHDMNGVELITALRQIDGFASTPIVVASGLDKEDEALAAGANKFMIKPFEPNDLAGIFYNLLG